MNKLLLVVALAISTNSFSQEFQGKAYYQTKTTMDLGSWGSKMSEQQKNMMKDRMKSFLEKTFILTFNKSESLILIVFHSINCSFPNSSALLLNSLKYSKLGLSN